MIWQSDSLSRSLPHRGTVPSSRSCTRRAASLAADAIGAAGVLQELGGGGQGGPVGGSFDRFELAGQAIPAPSNRNGDVAFFASLVRSTADEGLFIAADDRVDKLAAVGDLMPSGEHNAEF